MPEEEKCETCEADLKDNLKNIACRFLPGEKKTECEKAVEEFFDRPEIDPNEFIDFMKKKGLWTDG